MLDFTQHTTDDPGSAEIAAAEAVDEQPLFDAYSNTVNSVTERVGPAVVRVETGSKTPNAQGRGGLGS